MVLLPWHYGKSIDSNQLMQAVLDDPMRVIKKKRSGNHSLLQ